ncbi:hypothetical protein Tco_0461651 [Tanacetum coccineum]
MVTMGLTLSADLLQKALNVTPADSAHPFESPPAGKTDITFTRRRVPSNWLMKMKFNRLLNLIWMIMSTIYNKRWIIASQDETTGPSVHPEDATSTKMVGSNSKQSHVALAGSNPEHMQDVSVPLFPSFIIRVLRIILVILPEHPSDTKVFTMKMEILLEPTSNKLIVGTFKDGDGDTLFQYNQVHNRVLILKRHIRRYHESSSICFKASATLNIQAFKIKKSVSISFRMTQVHRKAKDHKMMIRDYDWMMIRDYDWMMISNKLKNHIQVKLKPRSLKFTASDSQDID